MAELTITLSANAGMAISIGDHHIWVDALHNDPVPGFSRVDRLLQGRMLCSRAFYDPDMILYTHCHPDHFSAELTLAAQQLWPTAKVCLPEKHLPEQILVTGGCFEVDHGDLQLRFIRLPHEGQMYADVAHYGILLSWQGKQILIPGDCQLKCPQLEAALEGIHIDVAILNFPWLTLHTARAFAERVICPKHWVVCHIPFEADDVNGYRSAVQTAAAQRSAHVLNNPLQTLKLDI